MYLTFNFECVCHIIHSNLLWAAYLKRLFFCCTRGGKEAWPKNFVCTCFARTHTHFHCSFTSDALSQEGLSTRLLPLPMYLRTEDDHTRPLHHALANSVSVDKKTCWGLLIRALRPFACSLRINQGLLHPSWKSRKLSLRRKLGD